MTTYINCECLFVLYVCNLPVKYLITLYILLYCISCMLLLNSQSEVQMALDDGKVTPLVLIDRSATFDYHKLERD